ncbi:MAG: hypothetical protein ABI388_07070, partial [Bacteroidia bacterium]
MKKYVVISFLLLSTNFFSQQINTVQPLLQQVSQQSKLQQNYKQPKENMLLCNNNVFYNNKASKYKGLKIGGIILSSVGAAAIIGGIVLHADGVVQQNNPNASLGVGFPQKFGGTALIVVGGLAFIGGIVMIEIGYSKEKEGAKNRISVAVAPTSFKIAY